MAGRTEEQAFDLPEGFAASLHVAVLVDLHGGGDAGMAEDELDVTRRHAEAFEQSGGGVAQAVWRRMSKSCLLDQPLKRPGKISRFDRPAGSGGEDQSFAGCRFRPATIGIKRKLPFLLAFQCLASKADHGQVAFTGLSLHRTEPEPISCPDELLADPDLRGLEVDVLPAEAQYFTATETVEDEECES